MLGDGLAFHKLAQRHLGSLHHQVEVLVLLDGESETGQCDERIAGAALEPRIAGKDISVVVLLMDMELVGGIDETVEEVIARGALFDFGIEQPLQTGGLALRCGSGKDDALALLDVHLEISGHVEVLIGSVATLLLLGILDSAIPVGNEVELVLLGELHIEVGVAGIHTGLDTIVYLKILARSHRILMGKLAHTAESQERTETQRGGRVGIYQRVADKDAVLIMLEHHFALKDYATDAIQRGGYFVTIKLTNILMTLGTEVVALILMEAQVELGSMLYHCHVERRKQYMVLVIELGNGHDKQSMILASVTLYHGGTRVGSRAVGA